jgi:hypothetical protein
VIVKSKFPLQKTDILCGKEISSIAEGPFFKDFDQSFEGKLKEIFRFL